MTTIINSYY